MAIGSHYVKETKQLTIQETIDKANANKKSKSSDPNDPTEIMDEIMKEAAEADTNPPHTPENLEESDQTPATGTLDADGDTLMDKTSTDIKNTTTANPPSTTSALRLRGVNKGSGK
jgi:hypothetical protein